MSEKFIRVKFIGHQECPGRQPMALFNLIDPVPGLTVNSTVSLRTLNENGFLFTAGLGHFKPGSVFALPFGI